MADEKVEIRRFPLDELGLHSDRRGPVWEHQLLYLHDHRLAVQRPPWQTVGADDFTVGPRPGDHSNHLHSGRFEKETVHASPANEQAGKGDRYVPFGHEFRDVGADVDG